MKLKLKLSGVASLMAACAIATAQTNTDTTTNVSPATAAAAAAAPDSAVTPPPATNAAPEVTATNVVSTNVEVTAPAPAVVVVPTNAAVVVVPATNAPAATPAPAPNAPVAAEPTNAPAAPAAPAVIPLIVMDEVPLTDAIKNLARQAGLNYMLDPKINYGTPGPDGVVHQQPTVSLRWENLTADQALNAVLNNYNLIIVDDPKSRIARITIKDPAAPDPLVTKIIQLKYASATNMMVSSQAILLDKRSKVISDQRTSQLVVVATEKEMVSIDDLIARLDTPTKQVLIEARVVETSKNPTSSKGIDWSGTLQAQHITFGNGNTTGTYTSSSGTSTGFNSGTGSFPVGSAGAPYIAGNPVTLSTTTPGGTVTSVNGSGATGGTTAGNVLTSLVGGSTGGLSLNTAKGFFPATAFLNADGVSAVLSFLNNNFDGTVLSTPRAVTLDNEEAVLSVTTAQPIFNTTAGTQGSPGGSQVLYTNLGTILHVTPRISANNTISLKVVPEVSDVAGTITKTVGGLVNQADVYDIRRIETRVLIPSGNTLVMGGLVDDNRTKSNVKVPVLGDIPFLGAAFRQETKTQNKKNLIIFVTPTIVQNEDFQPTESTFLKTKVPDAKASDFGPWDSTEPQDWSKLAHGKKNVKNTVDTTGDIPTTN